MAAPSNQAIVRQIIINFIPAKRRAAAQTSKSPRNYCDRAPELPRVAREIPLTMTVVFWVGSDVLEDERASRGDDKDLQHEVVECLKEDFAETLRLDRFAIVVSKEIRPGDKRVTGDASVDIDFKLVTDAIDT